MEHNRHTQRKSSWVPLGPLGTLGSGLWADLVGAICVRNARSATGDLLG